MFHRVEIIKFNMKRPNNFVAIGLMVKQTLKSSSQIVYRSCTIESSSFLCESEIHSRQVKVSEKTTSGRLNYRHFFRPSFVSLSHFGQQTIHDN